MSLIRLPTLETNSRMAVIPVFLLLGLSMVTSVWASADWERAVEAYQRGDLAVAIQELQGVVEAHPSYAPAHSFLGAALYRAGRAEESVAPLRLGLELGSSDEASRLVLVRALVDLERYDEATSEVQAIEGKEFRSDQLAQWEEALRSLAARGPDPQDLLPTLTSAVKRFPEEADLWTSLGRIEERLDRRAESLQSLARAARLEPSPARRARYLETALRFGDLEPDAGWYRSGAEEGERWDEVAPETALLIAECWLGAEGCKRATPWLDRAASGSNVTGSNVTGSNATGSNATGSKAAKALLYRGECAAAAKDSAAAVEFLEAARNRSTEDSATSRRILLALGDAYHAEHRYEAAAAVFAVAGETDRADAMTQAQQASLHNAEVDLRVAECRQRRDQYDALLAEHRDLEGTAEWLDLLRTSEERMSDCRAYL